MSLKIRFISLIFLMFAVHISVFSQKSVSSYNPEDLYQEGIILYQNKHYGGALNNFRQLLSMLENDKQQMYLDSRYYEAVSSLMLGNADGKSKILAFKNDYPCNSWSNQVNFLYGRILFQEKKYRDAIEAYRDIDVSQLVDSEQNEMSFNLAYSYLQTDNVEKALSLFQKVMKQEGEYQKHAKYYYAHTQYILGNDDVALEIFRQLRNDRTYSKMAQLYEMQINYRKGNYDEVIKLGEEVLKNADNRRKAEIAKMLAEAWFIREDYAKSLEYYQVCLNQGRRKLSRNDYFQMGLCQMKMEKYQDAIKNFQAVGENKDSISQYATYYLADCYVRTDQLKFAKSTFLSVYKSGIDSEISEDALFNYAKITTQMGSDPFNEATNLLQEYLKNNPDSHRKNEAKELIVYLLLSSKNYDAALDELEKMTSRSSEMQNVYAQLSSSAAAENFNDKNYEKAISFYSKVLESKADDKTRAEACFWLAEAYYQQKNYWGSEKYFRQFLGMRKASSLTIFPLASYNLGYTFYQKEDYKSAIPSFRQFVNRPYVENQKIVNDAWLRLGDCYFMQRDYNQAIASYESVSVGKQKEGDYALYQIGLAKGAQGKLNDKINVLNQLVKNYPKSTYCDKALFEIASTYLVTDDQRSAIASYNRLVKEYPRSAYTRQALIKMGLMYYNNNQYNEALENLKKVVSDYPSSDEAREAVNVMKNIYMDMNKLQDFFAYAEKTGIGQMSVTEQDSLAFAIAENFYQESRCDEAVKALQNYFTTFPQGAFLLKAHYYASFCLEKLGKQNEIMPHLEFIINFADNDYTDEALLKAARMKYDEGDFVKAGDYYERLMTQTTDNLQKIEAMEGSMKSNFFLENYDKSIQIARQLEGSDEITAEQKVQVHYILGKSFFELKNYQNALTELNLCAKSDKSVYAAEAAYLAAVSEYSLGNFEKAETTVFDIADQFANHEYWVAKSFILLADVYVANNNVFQAKETLKSIIDNYQGADLKQIAQQKLLEIEKTEGN